MKLKPNPLKWKIKYWLIEFKLGTSVIFAKNSVIMLGTICLFLMGTITTVSVFYHNYGKMTVSVDKQVSEKGVYLSTSKNATADSLKTRLFSNALDNCDNINIEDIPTGLNDEKYEGEHNGDNYIAYSFYIINGGTEEVSYKYSINITSLNKSVDKAMWLMFYRGDKLDIYAKERADTTPERQYSFKDYKISKDLGKQSGDYIQNINFAHKANLTNQDIAALGLTNINGLKELAAKPFVGNRIIASGTEDKIKPDDKRGYTVVAWLEGEDPDCVDEIRGGTIGFDIRYELVEEEDEKKEDSKKKNSKNNKEKKDNDKKK